MTVNADALSQFEEVEWDEILREKKIDFILGTEQLRKILKIIGNDFDEAGFITANGERIQANDASEIRIKEVRAVLSGSKVFIKNIAGFSQYFFDHKGK